MASRKLSCSQNMGLEATSTLCLRTQTRNFHVTDKANHVQLYIIVILKIIT
jgi:hypothetical protein